MLIILRTTPPNAYLFATQLVLLLCLRVANRELYTRYCNGHAAASDMLTYLRSVPGGATFIASPEGEWVEAHLVVGMTDDSAREAELARYREIAKQETISSEVQQRAKRIAGHFLWIGTKVNNMTRYLFKKIEMAHRFVPVITK
jgi:hypothetical protein